MNEILITTMLFCATMVVSMGSISAIAFLIALTKEFLSEQYNIWRK